MHEKVLKSRRIYDGKLINLDVVEVELPDGATGHREIVRHPGAVAMVPVLTSRDVLLVRQYRVAAKQIMLEIPAGTLHPGEAPAVSADRELREEIGRQPGSLVALGGFYTAPGYTSEYIHLFLAQDLIEAPLALDDDEFVEVVQMPLTDALQKINQGEIIDGKTVAGLLRAAHHLNVR